MSNRCQAFVKDKITGRGRKCRKKPIKNAEYCATHCNQVINLFINKCCFCGDEIKIDSQSCGGCARNMTMNVLGYF